MRVIEGVGSGRHSSWRPTKCENWSPFTFRT